MSSSIRSYASSTHPKSAASVTSAGKIHQKPAYEGLLKEYVDTFGENWAPIACLAGAVSIAFMMAIHTAKQNFLHSPPVQVTKTRRECVPEVEYPADVIRSADKYRRKSILRKIANIQDNHYTNQSI